MRVRLVLRTGIVACVASGAHVAILRIQQTFSPKQIQIMLDPQLNDQVRQKNQKIMEQLLNQVDPSLCIEQAMYGSKAIASCTIRHQPFGMAHVAIKGKSPLAFVNNNFVLTDDGSAVQAQEFTQESIENIPSIIISNYQHQPHNTLLMVATFIRQIPLDILSTYSITWIDKTIIILKSIVRDDHVLLVSYQTIFAPALLQAIDRVIDLQHHKKSSYRDAQSLIMLLDVRFHGQIVVRRIKKGDLE